MTNFPAIALLLRHRKAIVVAATLLGPIVGAWLTARTMQPDWLVAGLLLAPVLNLLARSYIELVRVISDMLLPQ